jgi:hypothetical protein
VASQEAVEKRLKKRNPSDPDLKKVAYIPTAYAKMRAVLERYKMPGLVIDTSEMGEKEVVDVMVAELKKRGLIDG